ncbi:MAG: tetratricopeptide repeat protein, partial [Planctomycetota bacterium]
YIASEPEFCEACLSLPESPMDLDLFEMLAGVVQMALTAHSDYADLHYYCSRIFDRLGRLDEAVEHARKALEINPRYVRAHLHMADVLARTDRCGDSAEHIEIAISCGADWPDVHCLAGELLLRLDERLRARKHFQRALELNANYARAAEALAKPAA